MGAWDVGIWDNDDAADWGGDLADTDGIDLLRDSLTPSEVKGCYLEAPEGVRILCVADTLRAALDLGKATVPDEVSTWVKEHANLDYRSLVPNALAKLRRVLAEHSELHELWKENEELYPRWREQVEALAQSLGR